MHSRIGKAIATGELTLEEAASTMRGGETNTSDRDAGEPTVKFVRLDFAPCNVKKLEGRSLYHGVGHETWRDSAQKRILHRLRESKVPVLVRGNHHVMT